MSASPEIGGKCRACEAIGASWRTQVGIFRSCILCLDSYRSRWSGMAFHSFLQRRSAPRKMVHLPSLSVNSIYPITVKLTFYDCSRMTGKYLLRSVINPSPFVIFSIEKPQGLILEVFSVVRCIVFIKLYFSFFSSLTRTLSITGCPSLFWEITSTRIRPSSGANSLTARASRLTPFASAL